MSISGTIFNAYSGLVAASRTAEVISDNVANAMTDGFGRRAVELSAASINGRGAGVRVTDIRRDVNQVTIADRRLAQADLANASTNSVLFSRLEATIGIPGEGGSLSDLTTSFEASLASAQSRPDSQVRLQNILFAATGLAGKINNIADAVQTERMTADQQIAAQVGTLNTTLENIDQLNRNIRLQAGSGHSVNGLMDQRQVLVDRVAEIIPLKTYPRDFGQIAIISTGGAVLLDGSPARFGFTGAGVITPDMTLASGALSGLTMNSRPVPIGDGTGRVGGGSLSAQFNIRDKTAVAAGDQIDAVARNLIERFETSGLDATLASGAAGLFTDSGAPLDTANEKGLANRLQVNANVDPSAGGDLWRLRAGLGASAAGEAGNAGLISGFMDVLNSSRTTASGDFSAQAQGFSSLVGEFSALNAANRLSTEEAKTFAEGRYQGLKTAEAAGGVDTDREMQKLMVVEKAYAANARVVSVVDQMLKTLMEL